MVDIQERFLKGARGRAAQARVEDRCTFTARPVERADVIVSIDSIEHFDDPAAILKLMRYMLKLHGYVLTSFGPTWYRP